MQSVDLQGFDVLSLEKRIAIALHCLKDQGSMRIRMTANIFGIARCAVGQVVQEICGILARDLGPDLIKISRNRRGSIKS